MITRGIVDLVLGRCNVSNGRGQGDIVCNPVTCRHGNLVTQNGRGHISG